MACERKFATKPRCFPWFQGGLREDTHDETADEPWRELTDDERLIQAFNDLVHDLLPSAQRIMSLDERATLNRREAARLMNTLHGILHPRRYVWPIWRN
jgi:hypothetical protein